MPEVSALFNSAPFRWWICGGWSLELGAVPRRHHEDVEVGFARTELPALREWLADYHLWDIHAGTLTLMKPDYQLPDEHEQLWLRRDAYSPWLIDLMLTPVDGETWFYKRDRRLSRPFEEAVTIGSRRNPAAAAGDRPAVQGTAPLPSRRRGFRRGSATAPDRGSAVAA